MTAIGIITAAMAVMALVFAPHRLWELAILTTPFQASTLVEMSATSRESGLAPVYLVLALACLYELGHWLPRGVLPRPLVRVSSPAICFLAWGILSAIAIPACFQGWLLVAPYSIYTLSRLEPSFSNITHCLYLTLLISTMILLAFHVSRTGSERVRSLVRAYEGAVWVSAGMIVWHHLSLYLGLPYPSEFLYNHPGVVHYEGNAIRPELALASGLLRASGPFSEASIAAAYLAGGFGLMVAEWVCGPRSAASLWKCVVLGMVILSTMSTSGVVLVSASLLCHLTTGAASGRWRQVARRLLLLLLILLAAPLTILMVSPQAHDEAELAVNYLLVNKFDSTTDASPRSRNVIEKNALAVFGNSYGLGAGLGSNVAFTAQGYIASSTGILGLGLCAWFARRVWSAYRERVRPGGEMDTGMKLRRLGGAMAALVIGGIAGSHTLLFVPIVYLILGMIIAGSCSAPWQSCPSRPSQGSTPAAPLPPPFVEQI